ncbi:triose-phosphate isomerase [Candidatus Wolfebacteria bacterium]|nr:triose-phosphate isomerase [Candidatus Wolfebacteria bacterium]
MMKKIIAFNWKMNPQSLGEAKKLFNSYLLLYSSSKKEIIVCPPFIYLYELKDLKTKNLKLGSQDVFWENSGAFTGEISPKMLKNLGAEYVIIGHSERRQNLNETDEMINKKILAALKTGLKIILCVGENLKTRKQGKKAVENFIKSQLQKDLKNLPLNSLLSKTTSRKGLSYILNSRLIIAYEPIWAIGTGNSDSPKDAIEIIKLIKKTLNSIFYILNPRVLYGGSVDSKNIKNFLQCMQCNEIDGFLIGSASLQPKEIKNIIKL